MRVPPAARRAAPVPRPVSRLTVNSRIRRQRRHMADGAQLVITQTLVAALAIGSIAGLPGGAELQQKTVDAFDRYVASSEARMDTEERSQDKFLYIDGL